MFLMLQRFIEIISDLELSLRIISIDKLSTPENKPGDPEKTLWIMFYFSYYHYLYDIQ
jgi:hypothetical protein